MLIQISLILVLCIGNWILLHLSSSGAPLVPLLATVLGFSSKGDKTIEAC